MTLVFTGFRPFAFQITESRVSTHASKGEMYFRRKEWKERLVEIWASSSSPQTASCRVESPPILKRKRSTRAQRVSGLPTVAPLRRTRRKSTRHDSRGKGRRRTALEPKKVTSLRVSLDDETEHRGRKYGREESFGRQGRVKDERVALRGHHQLSQGSVLLRPPHEFH